MGDIANSIINQELTPLLENKSLKTKRASYVVGTKLLAIGAEKIQKRDTQRQMYTFYAQTVTDL
jgi:hypothetical protein